MGRILRGLCPHRLEVSDFVVLPSVASNSQNTVGVMDRVRGSSVPDGGGWRKGCRRPADTFRGLCALKRQSRTGLAEWMANLGTRYCPSLRVSRPGNAPETPPDSSRKKPGLFM